MVKIGTFSGKEICRLLEKNGFEKVRQRGSHVVMQKRFQGNTVTVPIPVHDEIKIGTLSSIIRQTGLSKAIFLK